MYSVDNNGWISVDRCHPAEGCLVLLVLECTTTGDVRFDLGGIYGDDIWIVSNDWFEGTEDTKYTVTYWRPLPPPPACYKETLHYEL